MNNKVSYVLIKLVNGRWAVLPRFGKYNHKFEYEIIEARYWCMNRNKIEKRNGY